MSGHKPTLNEPDYLNYGFPEASRFAKPSQFKLTQALRIAVILITILPLAAVTSSPSASAQKRRPVKQADQKSALGRNKLAQLRDDYIRATKEYKASLEKLLAIYEANVRKAEERLVQSQSLFADGLIAKNQLEETKRAVGAAKDKVNETKQQMAAAELQIANTLVEAEADKKMAREGPIARGAFISTASYVRYNGPTAWSLSDSWKVQRFFLEAFKKPLPIAVFGQGAIHDRWRLDHHNAMDISLNPDGVEGQGLMNFLRANGIPFSGFREAIPGTATGPHIHIGRPSHRY